MTSSHATKAAIRERMARTGEPYSTARRNLLGGKTVSLPRRVPGTFTALTSWYCNEWNVETLVHGFAAAKEAAKFGGGLGPDSAHKLRIQGDQLVILTPSGQEVPIHEEDVTVSRQKDNLPHGKVLTDPDDFEIISILPRDFHTVPDLSSGFSSMAYGVQDDSGKPVKVNLDPTDNTPPFGDITSLFGLLNALEPNGSLVVQTLAAPDLSAEDRDWVIEATRETVDEGVLVLAIKDQAVEKAGEAFSISEKGREVPASLKGGGATVQTESIQQKGSKMNHIHQVIRKAIRDGKGILVAGRTGSGKHTLLSTLLRDSDPDHPRFVFSGEILSQHADGTANEAIKAGGVFQSILASGIPVAAEVQAETEEGAYERFSANSGLSLDTVKSLFPVVVVISAPEAVVDFDSPFWNKVIPGEVGGGMGFKFVLDPTGAPGFPPFPVPVAPEDIIELTSVPAPEYFDELRRQGKVIKVNIPSKEDAALVTKLFQDSVLRAQKT